MGSFGPTLGTRNTVNTHSTWIQSWYLFVSLFFWISFLFSARTPPGYDSWVKGRDMTSTQDARKPKFTTAQMKRLEKRYASLACARAGGGADTVTREAFCCQPEVSTNALVGAYLDRLLENVPDDDDSTSTSTTADGGNDAKHNDRAIASNNTLTFDDFTHVLWVFSSSASKSEKEKVLETLLEPDENGWVDRRSLFRFVRCMLSSAPEAALDEVVDGFIDMLATKGGGGDQSQGTVLSNNNSSSRSNNSSSSSSSKNSRVPITSFLRRGDLVSRLTSHVV